MTYGEFANLHHEDRYNILKDKAVKVGHHIDGKWGYFLFQLESFYLEMKTKAFSDHIESIICYEDTACVDKYINEIDVSCLIT